MSQQKICSSMWKGQKVMTPSILPDEPLRQGGPPPFVPNSVISGTKCEITMEKIKLEGQV